MVRAAGHITGVDEQTRMDQGSPAGGIIPTCDAHGNLTGDDAGTTYTYDAWDWLMFVRSLSNVTASHAYDALGRRVSELARTQTRTHSQPTDLYYNAAWQVVEERTGAQTAQNVWSP